MASESVSQTLNTGGCKGQRSRRENPGQTQTCCMTPEPGQDGPGLTQSRAALPFLSCSNPGSAPEAPHHAWPITLLPRNWAGSVQKDSCARNRRDRSTSWNSCSAGSICSCVEDRGSIPGSTGFVTFTPGRGSEVGGKAQVPTAVPRLPSGLLPLLPVLPQGFRLRAELEVMRPPWLPPNGQCLGPGCICLAWPLQTCLSQGSGSCPAPSARSGPHAIYPCSPLKSSGLSKRRRIWWR